MNHQLGQSLVTFLFAIKFLIIMKYVFLFRAAVKILQMQRTRFFVMQDNVDPLLLQYLLNLRQLVKRSLPAVRLRAISQIKAVTTFHQLLFIMLISTILFVYFENCTVVAIIFVVSC